MSDKQIDKADDEQDLLKEYLKGDSELSQSYSKLEQAEPATKLDQEILDFAAKNTSKKTIIPLWRSRLDSPFALAAVIVLSVSLVLLAVKHESLPELGEKEINGAISDMDQMPGTMNESGDESGPEDDSMGLNTPRAKKQSDLEVEEKAAAAKRSQTTGFSVKDQQQRSAQQKSFEPGRAEAPSVKNEAESKLENSSIKISINNIKALILNNEIDKARDLYRRLKTQIPKAQLEQQFSRAELDLLQQ